MFVCIYVCMYTCTHAYTHWHQKSCRRAAECRCMYTCMQNACMQMQVHVYMQNACMQELQNADASAAEELQMQVLQKSCRRCRSSDASMCMHVYMCTYIHIYIYTYIHINRRCSSELQHPVCMCTCIYALCACVHARLAAHACVHVYMQLHASCMYT